MILSSLTKVKIVLVIRVTLKRDYLPFQEMNPWVVLTTIIVIILGDSILLI